MFLFSTTASAQKYVGGDISMLPAYEKAGATYYTHDGEPINDLITYSKEEGWNAMRVRLFVNPTKQTTNSSAYRQATRSATACCGDSPTAP